MLKIKEGVELQGLQPQMFIAVTVADEVYEEFGLECVITSALDSQHGAHSLHYKGFAVDLRTKHIPDARNKSVISDKIQSRLGSQFQVVLENDHIHIEFDPA